MKDYIELAKALAMPVAISIAAICVLFSVIIIGFKKPNFRIKFKDWIDFGATTDAESPVESAVQAGTSMPAIGTGLDDEDETPLGKVADRQASIDEPLSAETTSVFSAKDAESLKVLFEKFRSEDTAYSADDEFWESWYLERRFELGISGDLARSLNALSEEHSDWVWPLIFLARRKASLSDISGAFETLEFALQRKSSKNNQYVLREIIRFKCKFEDESRAIKFVRSQLLQNVSDIDAASMLDGLVELIHKDGDIFKTAVFREMAIRFNPNDDRRIFDLAYAYAEREDLQTFSFEHYENLLIKNPDHANGNNNMGVIFAKAEMASASGEYYEKGLKAGSGAAISNIAKALIGAGLTDRASEVLGEAGGSSEESLLAEARKQLADAKAEARDSYRKLSDFSEEQYQKFSNAFRNAFNYWKSSDQVFSGTYEGAGLVVQIDGKFASCTASFKGKIFLGKLQEKALCYSGVISEETKSLMVGEVFNCLLVLESYDEISFLLFPKKLDISNPVDKFILKRKLESQ